MTKVVIKILQGSAATQTIVRWINCISFIANFL